MANKKPFDSWGENSSRPSTWTTKKDGILKVEEEKKSIDKKQELPKAEEQKLSKDDTKVNDEKTIDKEPTPKRKEETEGNKGRMVFMMIMVVMLSVVLVVLGMIFVALHSRDNKSSTNNSNVETVVEPTAKPTEKASAESQAPINEDVTNENTLEDEVVPQTASILNGVDISQYENEYELYWCFADGTFYANWQNPNVHDDVSSLDEISRDKYIKAKELYILMIQPGDGGLTEEQYNKMMSYEPTTGDYDTNEAGYFDVSSEAHAQFNLDDNGMNASYIIWDSDLRYLTEEDLMPLSDYDIKLARNEIYARKGRMFNDASIQEYFDGQSWYTPIYSPEEFDALGNSTLNEYEVRNTAFILEYEATH